MYINSALHLAWKTSTKNWMREMNRIAPRVPVRPSLTEPTREEVGEVLRALSPYLTRGLSQVNFSAILAATTASMETPPEAMYPAQYLGGLRESIDGTFLTWPRDHVSVPLVCMEPFPLASFWANQDDVPNSIAPYPTASLGRVCLTGYEGRVLFPDIFTSATVPTNVESVHPRELARVASGGVGLVTSVFQTGLNYTGCVRVATEAEVDELFTNIIRPESWIKLRDLSVRDFFCCIGISGDIIERSIMEGDRIQRASGGVVVPTESVATDVPARARPARNTGQIRWPGGSVEGDISGTSTSRPSTARRSSQRASRINTMPAIVDQDAVIFESRIQPADTPTPPASNSSLNEAYQNIVRASEQTAPERIWGTIPASTGYFADTVPVPQSSPPSEPSR